MADQVERLAHPLRVAPDGRLAIVVQDSDDDIRQCIRLTLATRPGDRVEKGLTQMGAPDPSFGEDIDAGAVRQMLERHEPRAPLRVDITQDELDAFTRNEAVTYDYDEPESEA